MEKDDIFLLLAGSLLVLIFFTHHILSSDALNLLVFIGAAFTLGGIIIRFPKLLKRLREQLKGEESSKENEDI